MRTIKSDLNVFKHQPDAELNWDIEMASTNMSVIPSKAYGCYAFLRDGEVVYVGSATSKNSGSGQCGLRLRLRSWKRKKRFSGCTLMVWYVSNRFDALSYEHVTIKEELPTDNTKHTTVGKIIKPFWRDGWWSVNSGELKAAKEVHGDGLYMWLNNMVDTMKVPPPYKMITESEAIADFKELCARDFTVDNAATTGRLSSDIFHQHNRWKVGSIREHSPVEGWSSPFIRKRVIRSFLRLGYDHVNRANMRSAIAMSLRIAGQFRPSVMKAFIDHYQAENVLDCCAGWGDRLVGFWASKYGKHYVGIDPNAENHKGYKKQTSMYNAITEKTSELICTPVEDTKRSDFAGKFDLSLTSPPYFNLEQYCYDEGQSHIRYTTYTAWVNGFFRPFMEQQHRWVKSGGIIAVCLSTKIRGSGGIFDMSIDCRKIAAEFGMTLDRVVPYATGHTERPSNEETLVFIN